MEGTIFKTLLNNNHKLRGNKFVEGKLLGMAEIICDLRGETREIETKNGKNQESYNIPRCIPEQS